MSTGSQIKLPYYRFWTKSVVEQGADYGTDCYVNFIGLCLPENYLPTTYKTEIDGHTNTRSAPSASNGTVTLDFTPVLLCLDTSERDKWHQASDSYTTAGVHLVTVTGIKFKLVKTLHLTKYGDAYYSWTELNNDAYTNHVSIDNDTTITLDLTYQVCHEGKDAQYLKLIKASNIDINGVLCPVEASENAFMTEVWEKSFSLYAEDYSAIGKLIKFAETNMQQYAHDIIFNDLHIGESSETTGIQRCKSIDYDGVYEDAPFDRTTAYVFDFTGRWLIYTFSDSNQYIQTNLEFLTDERSKTRIVCKCFCAI